MNLAWIAVPVLLAAASSYFCCRLFCARIRFPENVLTHLVLFFVFLLLPVHLAATLEIAGLLPTVSLITISIIALVPAVLLWLKSRQPALAVRPIQWGVAREPWFSFADQPPYMQMSIVLVLGTLAIFTLYLPVSFEYGWDGKSYHLPIAISWLQEQSLQIPESRGWKYSLPANSEVGAMLFLGAGLHRFAGTFNLAALLIAAAGIYLMALRVSRHQAASVTATLVFLGFPLVLFQAFSGYVDLFGACFIIGGIAAFMLRNGNDGDLPDPQRYLAMVIVACLAWGIAVGTRPTYYAYGGLCFLGALVLVWHERHAHRRSLAGLWLMMAGAAALPCYFWFLRALIATGNPIYPVQVHLFGVTLLDGFSINQMLNIQDHVAESVWKELVHWLTQPWVEEFRAPYPYNSAFGFGAVWATFVPIGLAYGAYLTGQSIRSGKFSTYAWLMGLCLVFAMLWWVGLHKLIRFGLPWIALSCVLAAPLFALLYRNRSKLFGSLLVLSVALTTMLTSFVPLHTLLGQVRTGAWNRVQVLQYPALIDALPEGTVIWNAENSPLNFALSGARLSNKVIYADWTDAEAAARFIARNRVDYVVDIHPFCCQALTTMKGKLILDRKVGPSHRWQVWKVERPRTRSAAR